MHAQGSDEVRGGGHGAVLIVDLTDRSGVQVAVRHLASGEQPVRWRFVSSWLDDPARRADDEALLAHRWALAALCAQRAGGPGAVGPILDDYLAGDQPPPRSPLPAIRDAERDLEATWEDLAWLTGGSVPTLPALVIGDRLLSLVTSG